MSKSVKPAPAWAASIFNAAGFPPAVTPIANVGPARHPRIVELCTDDNKRSSRAQRRIKMQTVAKCPTCGADSGKVCRTASGAMALWIHAPRTRASAILRGEKNADS